MIWVTIKEFVEVPLMLIYSAQLIHFWVFVAHKKVLAWLRSKEILLMFSRVDTGSFVGGSMLGGGTIMEVTKKSADEAAKAALEAVSDAAGSVDDAAKTIKEIITTPSIDIMQVDWLFFTDVVHLHTGGAIALIGTVVLIHNSWRGHKEKKKREERESFPNDIVRKVD